LHLLPYHHINQDIEELGRQRAALGDAMASLKGCAIVPSCSTNHDGIMPVAANKPNHLGSCSIAFQHHDAPLPIHCIKGLLKIKEDTIKWLELEI
jgi:hypothetical protein